jgi:hypothetical protein
MDVKENVEQYMRERKYECFFYKKLCAVLKVSFEVMLETLRALEKEGKVVRYKGKNGEVKWYIAR